MSSPTMLVVADREVIQAGYSVSCYIWLRRSQYLLHQWIRRSARDRPCVWP